MLETPPDTAADRAAFNSLFAAEQLAADAVEASRRAAPERTVSTRSKRRSIQRGPDAWKVALKQRAAPLHSARDLIEAVAEAVGP